MARPKGSTNKSTDLVRASIRRLLDNNTPRLESLLDKIEKEHGSLEAWKCITGLMEFGVPKLSRVEQQHLGRDGEKVDPAENILTWIAQHGNNGLPNKETEH